MSDQAVVLSGPIETMYGTFASAKAAIRLEEKGMGHSSGKSARKHWAKLLGLLPHTDHQVVIKELQRRMGAMISMKGKPTYQNIAESHGYFAVASRKGRSFGYRYGHMDTENPGNMLESCDFYKTEDAMWKGCCLDQSLVEEPEVVRQGERLIMSTGIKSDHAEVLNALSEMSESPYYATRKSVILRAEQIIVRQEAELKKLRANAPESGDKD